MAILRYKIQPLHCQANFCWPVRHVSLPSSQGSVCHQALRELWHYLIECFGLTSNASCGGIFLSVFFTMKCAPACCRYLANRSKRHTLAMTNPTAEIPPDLQRQLGQQPFRSRVWPPHLVPDQHR